MKVNCIRGPKAKALEIVIPPKHNRVNLEMFKIHITRRTCDENYYNIICIVQLNGCYI